MELASNSCGSVPGVAEDRRSEARLELGCELQVTVLLEGGDLALRGTVRNVSGRGLSLLVDRWIAPDTAVRLDAGGRLMLGEVVHATPDARGFLVGIELQQSLTWTRDLVRLLRALDAENSTIP